MQNDEGKPKSANWGCIFLLLILLLNAAILTFLMYMSLSPEAAARPEPPPSLGDMLPVVAKLHDSLAKVKHAVPGTTDSITLSEQELNVLLAMAISQSQNDIPMKNLSLRLKNGLFSANFTKDIGFSTPFGRNINASARIQFELKDEGKTTARLLSFKAGRLNVKPILMQWFLDRTVSRLESGKNSEEFKDIVISAKATPPNGMTVEYRPYELRKLVESHLDTPILKMVWNSL